MTSTADTIFALSSGAPPAAIAIVRVSGPEAEPVARRVAGGLPPPRTAGLRSFRDEAGDMIDRGLLLRFPSDESVTGENLVEFHVHGGRAVVARLLDVLDGLDGLRPAEPGEFSRRALLNGRLSLVEAEALSDLLLAETEDHRRAALAVYEGTLGTMMERWRLALLALSARVEALIDLDGEADVAASGIGEDLAADFDMLASDLEAATAGISMEELRDGPRVVIAGPPNSGKSSLLNMLVRREAAIVTSIAGTTRDLIEVDAAIGGARFRLVDTAGLRHSDDPVEATGIERAETMIATAGVLLWLGDELPATQHPNMLWLNPKCDLPERAEADGRLAVSAVTGEGRDALLTAIVGTTKAPEGGSPLTLNVRQRSACAAMAAELRAAGAEADLLLQAEHVRRARETLDRLSGRADLESVMDQLFGSFCVGK